MKLSDLSEKQIAGIAGGVLGVIAILFLYLSYGECKKIGAYEKLPGIFKSIGKNGKAKKTYGKMKGSVTQNIADMKGKIKTHNEKIEKKDELLDQIKSLQDEWGELEAILPKSTQFPILMRAIVKGAAERDVHIVGGVTRGDPVPYDGNTDMVKISIPKIEASLHDFGHFLYFLYVPLKRFIIVQSFKIESGAKNEITEAQRSGEKVRHSISMELVTFVEKGE